VNQTYRAGRHNPRAIYVEVDGRAFFVLLALSDAMARDTVAALNVIPATPAAVGACVEVEMR